VTTQLQLINIIIIIIIIIITYIWNMSQIWRKLSNEMQDKQYVPLWKAALFVDGQTVYDTVLSGSGVQPPFLPESIWVRRPKSEAVRLPEPQAEYCTSAV
jgi:hypothetical protein